MRIKIAIQLLGTLVCVTSLAHADEWIDNTYVGLDLQKTNIHFKAHNGVHYPDIYRKAYTGMSVYVGYNIDAIWGAELGYVTTGDKNRIVSSTTDENVSITGNSSAKLHQWFLDAVGYYEIYDNIGALGTVGLEKTRFIAKDHLTTSAKVQGSANSMGLRFGVGVKYDLTHNLAARVMLRYSFSDLKKTAQTFGTYNIGLTYLF